MRRRKKRRRKKLYSRGASQQQYPRSRCQCHRISSIVRLLTFLLRVSLFCLSLCSSFLSSGSWVGFLRVLVSRFRASVSVGLLVHMTCLAFLYFVNNQLSFVLLMHVDPGTVSLFKSLSTLIAALMLWSCFARNILSQSKKRRTEEEKNRKIREEEKEEEERTREEKRKWTRGALFDSSVSSANISLPLFLVISK